MGCPTPHLLPAGVLPQELGGVGFFSVSHLQLSPTPSLILPTRLGWLPALGLSVGLSLSYVLCDGCWKVPCWTLRSLCGLGVPGVESPSFRGSLRMGAVGVAIAV